MRFLRRLRLGTCGRSLRFGLGLGRCARPCLGPGVLRIAHLRRHIWLMVLLRECGRCLLVQHSHQRQRAPTERAQWGTQVLLGAPDDAHPVS